MNRIKSAAIIGAGALGLLYAGPLKKRLGKNFSFIADEKRSERIRAASFLINGTPAEFNSVTPEQLTAPPDILIVAVKNNHIGSILPLVEKTAAANTIIISVLNGIDSEDILRSHLPDSEIMYTVALGMDAVKEDSCLKYSSAGKLVIGAADNDKYNPSLTAAAGFLEECGINCEIPDDIRRSLWLKWMINIGVNQVSAVTGATYGVFQTDETIQKLMDSAMKETVAVAEAAGVDLRDEDIKNWYPILHSLGAGNKTSMLQDIEAGRKTEAESFSGRLIELGERYGIEVPVNRTLYGIIKTRELLYS